MPLREYRIPMPMTVEEYRIAQLYMIQKKSRVESQGRDCGVEIMINEPYHEGPGGSGQFTKKVYHISRFLPGWFRGILPKQLSPEVYEEAWNAYPYTKTRYTSPHVTKFSLEIETVYHPDVGTQNNVFQLSEKDLKARTVDVIDIVKDNVPSHDYLEVEDPRLFVSEKTGRGPLDNNWIEDYRAHPKRGPVMCAYKICRLEFKYWGMQSKLEEYICYMIRKTMVRAHRQAWCWQDEYHGLTISDIRRLERETQLALAAKMGNNDENMPPPTSNSSLSSTSPTVNITLKSSSRQNSLTRVASLEATPSHNPATTMLDRSRSGSKQSFHSPSGSFATDSCVLEGLRTDLEDGSEDEFFDAPDSFMESEEAKVTPLVKWSSMELVEEDEVPSTSVNAKDDSIFSANFKSDRMRLVLTQAPRMTDTTEDVSETCPTSVLILVFHGGCILDNSSTIDLNGNRADISTFSSCFETVINAHYPSLSGQVVVKGVRCPPICAEPLSVLSSLTPYSFDAVASSEPSHISQDLNHLSALSLFATSSSTYRETLSKCISKANQIYSDFLHSAEGKGYKGPVCLVGDNTAGLLVYDALCRYGTHEGSSSSISSERNNENYPPPPFSAPAGSSSSSVGAVAGSTATTAGTTNGNGAKQPEAPVSPRPMLRPTTYPASRSLSNPGTAVAQLPNLSVFAPLNESGRYLSAPIVDKTVGRRASDHTTSSEAAVRFDFDVGDVFTFGCPLGLILAYRKFCENADDRYGPPQRPWCSQLFNLFHAMDPSATRIEPLLSAKFAFLKPVSVPRYQKFPLGDGRSFFLYEQIQQNKQLFEEKAHENMGDVYAPSDQIFSLQTVGHVSRNWWGSKRIDYALYCPEGAGSFPISALPHLFHASFWESLDVVAFMIRQIFQPDNAFANDESNFRLSFSSQRPTEKWLRRRTSIKLKNMHPNHRGNDVVVGENQAQTLHARFMYGPLDLLTLTGERVDVYVMTQPPSGEWVLFGTEVTSGHGRVDFTVPDDKKLGLGMYPVKMVVRGDHTSVDLYLTIVPSRTEAVVFSIDGSFTASLSVTGKDPKVRAGAVDIVRHWQELGYLIIYITGRPDMQHQAVVRWLAHHNFPHGMVSFSEGVSTDPQGQKSDYLKDLIEEAGVIIRFAYGSAKDIQVYTSVGLKAEQIYCIGKASKRFQEKATMLNDGYSAHLNALMAPGGSRPAQGNARMMIRRGCFSLPVPTSAPEIRRNKSINRQRRTSQFPESPPPSSSGTSAGSASSHSPYTPRFSFRTHDESSPKDEKDSQSLKGSIGGGSKRRGFFHRF